MERQCFEPGSAPQANGRPFPPPTPSSFGEASRKTAVPSASAAERAPVPGGLSPWDPLCAAATDLRMTFLEPVRAKVVEALTVLKELSGRDIDVNDELAVEAFSFALVDLMAMDAGAPDERRKALLELLAAQVFFSPRNPSIKSPSFFWGFLNDLARKYRGPLTALPPGLHSVVDRFLAHYGLSGEENADVVNGLERIVSPLVDAGRKLVLDRTAASGA